ncbi:Hypothetical protein PACV_256 [Pacmanvirus A23]|uniref:Hypothetical protein n=1 Tax=Pacmanvirus A23 TaxID=1932881 RepID=UPI000A092042|nr:Hypothetical protein B9W72_gp254 [Pacmanvirus A23]SIP85971.1 Hypothetical protein PACV_256 [Pacmanvirus A23]
MESCSHPTESLDRKALPSQMAYCTICAQIIDVRVKPKSRDEREREARLKIFSSWFKN